MKEIIEKIKEIGFDEYAVSWEGDKAYILVFMGYGYYRETDKDNFSVSPYYFASNKSYFSAKELIQYIQELGYRAEMRNHDVYDEILEKCGLKRGENNLFFANGLGSLFCVQMIETDAPMEIRVLEGPECTHCKRCIKACPMGALKENGLDAELCLRDRMDKVGDTLCRDKISTLLGCDICQRVCPNNSHEVTEKNYPQFNKEKIISGDMEGIGELVGKNMARKHRLQFQAMCIVANRRDKEYENQVERVSSAPLETTKNWCLERLKQLT